MLISLPTIALQSCVHYLRAAATDDAQLAYVLSLWLRVVVFLLFLVAVLLSLYCCCFCWCLWLRLVAVLLLLLLFWKLGAEQNSGSHR